MQLKRLVSIATVLVLVAGLVLSAGCNKPAGESGPAKAAEPIKIGVVTSVTGPLAGYGDQEIKGLKLGIAYATNGTNKVLGRDIQLIIEDDTGSPDVGKQKAIKLLDQDKVQILQGTAATPVALAVADLAKQYQVIFMADPAAGDQLTTTNFNPYIFRTGSNVSQDALTGGKAAIESMGKKFVHLAPDNAFGKSSQAAWDAVFTAFGGTLVKDVSVPLDAKDFSTYLQQVIDLKPDFLMVTWAGGSALKLFQQINEMGLYSKMKVTTGVGDRAGLKGLGDASVGVQGMVKYFYTLPKNPVNDWLVTEHKKLYNEAPDLFTAGGMSAGIAIVKGIEKAGSTDAAKMIPALEGMSFAGPKGTYTFRKEDHQALQPMYFVKLVKDPGFDYPVPQLIKEYSATETAPPIKVAK
ncbi:MAG: substrate-binding domain-containing protein [Symbiobacteriia bacterium]